MIDMKQVAKLAGVSVATVSKTINNYREVSDETKAKIMKIVDELGYVQNSSARALSTKRSNLIGIVYSEHLHIGLEHYFFSGVLEAFKKEVENLGYDVVFINGRDIGYLKKCRVRGVDGVFVVTAETSDKGLVDLFNADIPCVTTDTPWNKIPLVYSDNVQSSIDAVKYLHGLNHTRIAHIAGPQTSISGRERLEGYRTGMKHENLPYDPNMVAYANEYDSTSGYNAMKSLLEHPNPPSAVYVVCDLSAVGAIKAIRDANMRAPRDISIMGFDDIQLASHTVPSLTTLRQDRDSIGRTLACTLIKLINKEEVDLVTKIPCQLIERESTKVKK
ncbi:MAG: LacI family transcriptional regulator [Erysipelotrichaceae bacterium]|nr:MAG: LacI family transcriptional [Erysipelotrichaceae bacterium]TXT18413.1 MAG: LacI family transcriptional regulator [Erysipelotrichaceae bacterium]